LGPGDDTHPVGFVPFDLSLVLDEVHQALQLRAIVIARGSDWLLALTCPTSCYSLLTGWCQQLNFARGYGSTCQGFSMKFLCSVCLLTHRIITNTNFSWQMFCSLGRLAVSKDRSKTVTALFGHLR